MNSKLLEKYFGITDIQRFETIKKKLTGKINYKSIFPPCFIQFLSSETSAIGIYTNPFTQNNFYCYITRFSQIRIIEYGVNIDSLLMHLILENDEEKLWDDNFKDFTDWIEFGKILSSDFNVLNYVDIFRKSEGDLGKIYRNIFGDNVKEPLINYIYNNEEIEHSDYSGSNVITISDIRISKESFFCFTGKLQTQILNIKSDQNIPHWLITGNKVKLFNSYIIKKEYEKAWLTLNSLGWSYTDAKKALAELAEKSDNEEIGLICDYWFNIKWEEDRLMED